MMWSLGFLVIGIIWVISVYNGIIHAEVKIEEAKSGIDVALSKRYAILTNMQESVKGYMKHEKELPPEYKSIIETEGLGRAVCDYVACMTDRYALERFKDIYIPLNWQVL